MRAAEIIRKTKETDINVFVDLDGKGKVDIDTGIGFFDHMLTAFGVHAGLDLMVKVKGDLCVDAHHTVEDAGIVIGQALYKALGDKRESSVTEVRLFRWTKLWDFARWI